MWELNKEAVVFRLFRVSWSNDFVKIDSVDAFGDLGDLIHGTSLESEILLNGR